jgi:hypothetical protein
MLASLRLAQSPAAGQKRRPAIHTGVLHDGYNSALPTLFLPVIRRCCFTLSFALRSHGKAELPERERKSPWAVFDLCQKFG